MRARQEIASTVVAVVVVLSLVAAFAVFGGAVSPVAADQHTTDQAPDMSEYANYTVVLPHPSDHYPGDQNEANGSIEYYSVGEEGFAQMDAEEGIWMDYILVSADWIDYSACDTENTVAFGIDRDNDDPGTHYDDDLVAHRKDSTFRSDGLDVWFYNWDDLGGDTPYLGSEDEVVAAQGAGSNGGSCLTMTSEPGWYQVQTFFNGTVANEGCTEEGNADCRPEGNERVGAWINSNYIYICDCDSEQEAREELGPPPNEDPGPTPTQTDDGTDDPTPTETDGGTDDPTPTETDDGTDDTTATPTATQTDDAGGDSQDTQTQSTTGDGGDDGPGNATPSPGEGPGFGSAAAVLALLATALLANRRR